MTVFYQNREDSDYTHLLNVVNESFGTIKCIKGVKTAHRTYTPDSYVLKLGHRSPLSARPIPEQTFASFEEALEAAKKYDKQNHITVFMLTLWHDPDGEGENYTLVTTGLYLTGSEAADAVAEKYPTFVQDPFGKSNQWLEPNDGPNSVTIEIVVITRKS